MIEFGLEQGNYGQKLKCMMCQPEQTFRHIGLTEPTMRHLNVLVNSKEFSGQNISQGEQHKYTIRKGKVRAKEDL